MRNVTDKSVDLWLPREPRTAADIHLVCFPPSGATSSLFSGWHSRLSPQVDVLPLQLPGRGPRTQEPLVSSMSRLADMVANEVVPVLGNRFAFFGHSMGAMLAYATAIHLVKQGMQEPAILMVSGIAPPHVTRSQFHELDDDKLISVLVELGGYRSSYGKNWTY